ncbi:putative monooxygenase yxeK [Kluyveromyces marxianus]|uniref:Monooxygenase yxeK n=1 Tax=Kluyveromyces marxianus TaxID=4911 RepID=A0ABX6F3F8_KLUMA|nr:putative monooxygenase yxeK [Kluyveromyces marxianus]
MTQKNHGDAQQPKRQKTNDDGKSAPKNIILNAFLMSSPGLQVINSWRNEKDQTSTSAENPEYWIELAKVLERGGFNAVFFADVLGPYDVYKGPGNFKPVAKAGAQWPLPDPSYYIPLMAAVTKRLAFGITISTISEQPYHLARRLGTLDLITGGRAGWNIVTSYLDSASRNLLNGQNLPDKVERYKKAEEFVDVIYKLFLSSWQDGAVKADKKKGVFTDPEGLRHINHEGKYFNVQGPGLTQPSQQKLPVIIQAGTSPKGKELAARNAEIIFLNNPSKDSLKKNIDSVKYLAQHKFGRDPSKIKFLLQVTIIIGDTAEDVKQQIDTVRALGDDEAALAMFSGWSGIDISAYTDDKPLEDIENVAIASTIQSWKIAYPEVKVWTKKEIIDRVTVSGSGILFAGTPKEVADTIQDWVEYTGVDGFNFAYTNLPGTFKDIADKLVPELRKRGLVPGLDELTRANENGLSFRQQLFGTNELDPTHPASELKWKSNESREEFEHRFSKALEKLHATL